MDAVVEASGLGARYGRRTALTGLDVDLPGGVTALLGPNGAGKTTLLHLLCGLHRPSAGTLTVLGIDMSRRTARRDTARRTGFLPQHFGYLPGYTAREFVQYAAWLKGLDGAATLAAADRALNAVDMADRAGSKMRSLSGGMVRRVGVASAIVHGPDLLILDEPSVGLDPAQRSGLNRLIMELGRTTAVVLSTHLLDDVESACPRVLVLDQGRTQYHGPTEGLRNAGAGSLELGYARAIGPGTEQPA